MDARGVERQSTSLLKEPAGSRWLLLRPLAVLKEIFGRRGQQRADFPRMVNWYDPKQLLQTGIEVFVSTTLGRHADRRSIEASNREARFFDFSVTQVGQNFMEEARQVRRVEFDLREVTDNPEPKEIWIDYVSDLGDGFNSTYAVAYSLTQDALDVPGVEEPLKRGQILIFGGDEVYPTADRKEYKERLVNPYHWAWRELPANSPYLFALPGNHDWYDSLSSFMEFFGDHELNQFAKAWQVPQNRSYFALKLPQGWWLLGVDLQLQSDLDYWQIRYFEKIVNLYMQPGDRIILCCAEPFWVYEKLDPQLKQAREGSNLYRLIEILKTRRGQTAQAEDDTTPEDKQIAVYLAGDLHHYFRVWGKDDNQERRARNTLQITSGGGGAFLHPTHGAMARAYRKSDFSTKSYPSAWRSWWLGWINLGFPLWNWRFGIVTAGLYLLIGWFTFFSRFAASNPFEKIVHAQSFSAYGQACLQAISASPLLAVLLLLTAVGFTFFTLTEHTARAFRWSAGLLHAAVHISAAFYLLRVSNHFAAYLTSSALKERLLALTGYAANEATFYNLAGIISLLSSLPNFLIIAILLLVGGGVVGASLMGLYLLISLNVFGQHLTGAFSSLKIEDWKNFLRLRINLETGELTIYPIGIRRVPRKWKTPGQDDGIPLDPNRKAHYQPANEADIEIELIEGPIIVTPIEGHVDRVNVSLKGNAARVKRSNQWLQRYHLERLPFRKKQRKKES
jgi:hypothetical protein